MGLLAECLEKNVWQTAAGIVEPAVHAWIMDQATHSRNILGATQAIMAACVSRAIATSNGQMA